MSVQVGHPAPDFEVEAYVRGESEPRRLALSGYRGNWLVLFFYARDFTELCSSELQAFAELCGEFEREGGMVLAASTDSYFSHRTWFTSEETLAAVDFPVIADTSHRLARDYQVLLDDGTALRGTFLVDPTGIVRHLQVNDLEVGRNVSETLRILRALRSGQLCPAQWEPEHAGAAG